jgi:RHS repeat-associated protein
MNRAGGIYCDAYRYGYQGSEKDDEVKGSGNSYTTEFRLLDPRLGRWLSIDPLAGKFPWQSPYVSMDNNPISITDIFGLEGQDWIKRAGSTQWEWDANVESSEQAISKYGNGTDYAASGTVYTSHLGDVRLLDNRGWEFVTQPSTVQMTRPDEVSPSSSVGSTATTGLAGSLFLANNPIPNISWREQERFNEEYEAIGVLSTSFQFANLIFTLEERYVFIPRNLKTWVGANGQVYDKSMFAQNLNGGYMKSYTSSLERWGSQMATCAKYTKFCGGVLSVTSHLYVLTSANMTGHQKTVHFVSAAADVLAFRMMTSPNPYVIAAGVSCYVINHLGQLVLNTSGASGYNDPFKRYRVGENHGLYDRLDPLNYR